MIDCVAIEETDNVDLYKDAKGWNVCIRDAIQNGGNYCPFK
jgi:hypothetical protein